MCGGGGGWRPATSEATLHALMVVTLRNLYWWFCNLYCVYALPLLPSLLPRCSPLPAAILTVAVRGLATYYYPIAFDAIAEMDIGDKEYLIHSRWVAVDQSS